jgi:hypothetical protein
LRLNVIEGPIPLLILTSDPSVIGLFVGTVGETPLHCYQNNKTFSKIGIIIREIKKPVY